MQNDRGNGTSGTLNAELGTSFRCAAEWLAFTAPVRREGTPFAAPIPYPHGDYTGAMRTEYDTKARQWSLNGPVWHTGQAIRAMLVAERRLGDDRYREAAVRGGAFILREQRDDGLLLSFEDRADRVNVQVSFEAISGLLDLHRRDGRRPLHHGGAAGGGFHPQWRLAGGGIADSRPLHARPARLCGRPRKQTAGAGDARRRDAPATGGRDGRRPLPRGVRGDGAADSARGRATGNVATIPAVGAGAWAHPRPQVVVVGLALARCIRRHGRRGVPRRGNPGGDYYLRTANLDGGHYYTPNPEGRHNSYGVCVSVAACAGLLWHDLWRRTGDDAKYLPAIRRSVGFLLAAQFADDVEDANVRGALFESLNVPDGSLAPGFRVRDIAAIFALRLWDAALDTLHCSPETTRGLTPR